MTLKALKIPNTIDDKYQVPELDYDFWMPRAIFFFEAPVTEIQLKIPNIYKWLKKKSYKLPNFEVITI